MSNTNCLSVTELVALGRLGKLTKQTDFYLRFGDKGLLRVKLRCPGLMLHKGIANQINTAKRGSDSNGAKSHVKGRSWDRLASQDLSPSVSQGTIWRYVAVDGRLGYD